MLSTLDHVLIEYIYRSAFGTNNGTIWKSDYLFKRAIVEVSNG